MKIRTSPKFSGILVEKFCKIRTHFFYLYGFWVMGKYFFHQLPEGNGVHNCVLLAILHISMYSDDRTFWRRWTFSHVRTCMGKHLTPPSIFNSEFFHTSTQCEWIYRSFYLKFMGKITFFHALSGILAEVNFTLPKREFYLYGLRGRGK